MPGSHEMPERLRRFVRTAIDSLEQLDALVIVVRADHFWSAAELASELRLPASAAEQALEALASRGLLEVRLGTRVLYRYAPAHPDLGLAAEIPEYYPAARAEVVRQSTPRRRALRHFADAFQFRHPDDPDHE